MKKQPRKNPQSKPKVSADSTSQQVLLARHRVLHSQLQEQLLDFSFDRIRYGIESDISHPFSRRRYDAFGRKFAEDNSVWQKARDYLNDARNTRLSVYGVAYHDQNRQPHSQCEFRTLVAECQAFCGDYEAALRELRLAVSSLDVHSPEDQFHHGIVQGLRAEFYMLRADAHLRRRWKENASPARNQRFRLPVAVRRRNRAHQDLMLGTNHLNAAQDLMRDYRWNVSRWEWLYEMRAQLVIERLLLRCFELDFEFNVEGDDWRLIGGIQRELMEGLDAIRAAMDCTVYPHHIGVDSQNLRDETKHLFVLHRRIVGLWLTLLVASHWTLRLLAVGASGGFSQVRKQRQSPRLEAIERFHTSGSLESFWKRWLALNQAAGLNRFVEQGPGEVARNILFENVSLVGDLLTGNNENPPAMLREFVLAQMCKLFSGKPGKSPVDIFQKALTATNKFSSSRDKG